MKRFVPLIAAVLLVVVAGTFAPAAAKDRPFKSSGTGTVAGDLFASEFQATHLGKSSLVLPLEIPVDFYYVFFPFSATLTSANGDELYFDFDAQAYGLDYQEDEAIWVVNATVTFTGGTGRFRDANGSADMTIDFTVDFHAFDFLIDGSIDY